MSLRVDVRASNEPLSECKRIEVDVTSEEFLDFLRACQITGESSKGVLGSFMRRYISKAEEILNSKGELS